MLLCRFFLLILLPTVCKTFLLAPSSRKSPSRLSISEEEKQQRSSEFDLPTIPLVKTIAGGESLLFQQQAARWAPKQMVPPSNSDLAHRVWKNARKRNRPSLYRYSLRTFFQVKHPTNIHYEGALVACAKLGDFETALKLYHQIQDGGTLQQLSWSDNCMLSLIRAGVRHAQSTKQPKVLDQLVELLERHAHETTYTGIHWNPIAAAYAKLNCPQQARTLLQNKLTDRRGDAEAEVETQNSFNIYDLYSKDKSSYNILVSTHIQQEDWGGAVQALRDMTDNAGLYPTTRQLQSWNELSD